MSPTRIHFLSCLLGLTFFASDLFSKEIEKSKEILKVGWENDVYLFSDREYTNGVKLEYGLYKKTYSPSALLLLALDTFLPAFRNPTQAYTGVSIQHSIYTPINLYSADTSYGERPYSAYALLSNVASYTWDKSALSFETSLGQLGPNAQGKYLQEKIHILTNSPIPQGWDSQIPKQNLYQLNTDWKLFFNKNIGIQTTVKLGNLDTSISFGPIFRIGNIKSPVSTGLNIQDQSPNYDLDETESYFYFRPSIRDQSMNSTLGGKQKNELTAIVQPTDSSSLVFNKGQTIFIGEPLYNSLLDESSNSALTRFFLYDRTVAPDTPFGMKFLVFNTIFNGASVPGDGLKLAILETIFNPNFNRTKYPGVEYFFYDTLFRDETTGVSIFSKLLAVQYFYSNGVSRPETDLITAFILYNDQNAEKTYHVDLRRFQGRISTGYVFQNQSWFFQAGLEVSSIEYKASDGVPAYHRYTSFQLGKKF